MPVAERMRRVARHVGLATDGERAGIDGQRAVDAFHDLRAAGAEEAEDGQHLAAPRLQVDGSDVVHAQPGDAEEHLGVVGDAPRAVPGPRRPVAGEMASMTRGGSSSLTGAWSTTLPSRRTVTRSPMLKTSGRMCVT